MTEGTIILLGDLATEVSAVHSLAEGFGWSVERAADLKEFRLVAADRKVVAVLLDAHTLGLSWDYALNSVRKVAPHALPIVCHRFSETIEWPELVDAGAFHALPVPFDPSEVRQSLGFVSAASQSAASQDRHKESARGMRQVA